MSVDLRNFVQVNINYHQTKPLDRTRDTVVLFDTEDLVGTKLNTHVPKGATAAVDYFSSIADYNYAVATWNEAHHDASINPNAIKAYVNTFFLNGGLKLRVIGGYDGEDSDDGRAAWIVEQCAALPAEQIVVASTSTAKVMALACKASTTIDLVPVDGLVASSVSALTGYKEKMFLTYVDMLIDLPSGAGDCPNLVVKYGWAGAEMAVAAYMSKVNIVSSNSVKDYCYTIEDLSEAGGQNAIVDDNANFVELANAHVNVATTLANSIRNVYGDTASGADMMNYYVRIILTQTLTDRIISVLASKIKFDREGINKVSNSIAQELNIYKSNGYLNTEAIWTEDDLYYSFNGVDYLVCARNTPLKMGYKFTILPITSLTAEQRDAHAFPPVYVLIADSYSIRRIVISGDAY